MSQRWPRPLPDDRAELDNTGAARSASDEPVAPHSRDHGDAEYRFHRDGIRAGLAELAERLGATPPPGIARDDGERPESADEEADKAPAARPDEFRMLEALLFAAREPVEEKVLAKRLPSGTDVHAMLKRLALDYAPRGINLVRVGQGWAFRTANDLAWLLTHESVEPKKLSRAAVETLAIIAYHQPVTRAEIEDIRGVAAAKGTLDVLLETGWIRPRGRRKAPGRPLTFGTTEAFLSHFGLEQLNDLPGLDELKAAGMFDGQLPAGFAVPAPSDDPALREDEDPLEPTDLDLGLAPRPEAEPSP